MRRCSLERLVPMPIIAKADLHDGSSHICAMRKLPVVLLCRTISELQKSANQKYIPH